MLPEEVPAVFRSGMSASVDIVEASRENVLLIPFDVVQQDKTGSFVLLSQGKDKTPLRRKVTLGISDGNNVEVIAGLAAEDKIIAKNEEYIPAQEPAEKSNPFMPFGRRRRR